MKSNTVILCHPACTGGSLIYRLIKQTFGFVGVSEVSPSWPSQKRVFNPIDPVAQLFQDGHMDTETFASEFFSRIKTCSAHVTDSGNKLLIREHTHSLYFQIRHELNSWRGPSWVAAQYEKENVHVPVICTFRNPIDSWLGFEHSFPNLATQSFDSYCESYLKWLDQIAKWENNGGEVLRLKYEELIEQPEEFMTQVSRFLNLGKCEIRVEAIGAVSSGSSGRRSKHLELRQRRPYTSEFLNRALSSEAYARLASQLSYPMITNSSNVFDRTRLLINDCTVPIFKRVPINRLLRRCVSRVFGN